LTNRGMKLMEAYTRAATSPFEASLERPVSAG